jgi:hypothetical protein
MSDDYTGTAVTSYQGVAVERIVADVFLSQAWLEQQDFWKLAACLPENAIA